MQHRLDAASELLPRLAAKIHLDQAEEPLPRTTPSPLKLVVRTYEAGEYKSYDELARRSFLSSDFEFLRLVPEVIFAPMATERPSALCS